MRAKSKSAPVGVISKVLRILELLDRSPNGLSLKELSGATGLNKSTVHRFASHLEAEAYLFRDGTGTYTLGPKLSRLGNGISFQATLCRICRPVLEQLWNTTGETVNLAVLDGSEVLYLDVLETRHTFRLVSNVGMRRPFYCTSLGKAILATMDDDPAVEALCDSISFESLTPRTITSVPRLKKDLLQTRVRGFSLDEEEAVTGIRCLGAAILGADGKTVGGISISAPMVRVTKDRLPSFASEICAAAQELSRRLGYRVPRTTKDNSPSGSAPIGRGPLTKRSGRKTSLR